MTFSTIDDLKSYLQSYREAEENYFGQLERYATLEARSRSARTTALDGMPHGGSGYSDRTGLFVARLIDFKEELQREERELDMLREELESLFDLLRQAGRRDWAIRKTVLSLRYVDLQPWEAINEKLFGTYPNFEDRPESYLRRTHRHHSAALKELLKLTQDTDMKG